jgi:hypothetical protein
MTSSSPATASIAVRVGAGGTSAAAAITRALAERGAAYDVDPPALAGARVVIAAGAPDEAIVAAAIEAGCHYVDAVADQGFLRDVYERHGGAAARRGVALASGMGFDVALGDWAAAWAATLVAGPPAPGDDGARIGEDEPLDEVTVAYAIEAGARAHTAAAAATRAGWVWDRDQWDPVIAGAEQRTINFGPELGGERPAMSFPSGEVITVPRRVASRRVQTFVSLTRSRWLGTLARAATRLAPALARAGAGGIVEDALAGVAGAAAGAAVPADTRFAVIARARRRFTVAQVRVCGADPDALTAAIVADAAIDLSRLAAHAPARVGACTPSELWDPQARLEAIAARAGLVIEAA